MSSADGGINLDAYLWKEARKEENELFPLNGMGSYVLKRKRVVTGIMTEIKYQRKIAPTDSTSIYLGGIRGSGKTTLC